jgi:hypothetical protein
MGFVATFSLICMVPGSWHFFCVVTSASHDLALAWHPVLSSSSPLLSSLFRRLHTHPTELIAFRSSAPGRDILLHWRYVAGRLQPTPRVSNTQPTGHSILWALLFGVAFYTAGLPTFFLSDAHLRPMPGFETIRWLTRSSLHIDNQARFM